MLFISKINQGIYAEEEAKARSATRDVLLTLAARMNVSIAKWNVEPFFEPLITDPKEIQRRFIELWREKIIEKIEAPISERASPENLTKLHKLFGEYYTTIKTTWNTRLRTLNTQIESLSMQRNKLIGTAQELELLLATTVSTSYTEEMVEALKDPRIEAWKIENNTFVVLLKPIRLQYINPAARLSISRLFGRCYIKLGIAQPPTVHPYGITLTSTDALYYHPHVYNNTPCMGDYQSDANSARETFRLADLLKITIDALSNYNPNSPYRDLASFTTIGEHAVSTFPEIDQSGLREEMEEMKGES